MPFTTGYLADPTRVGAGARYDSTEIILSSSNYENGLQIGRFAKLDAGRIDNVDGSVAPTFAGVVLNFQDFPVDVDTISDANYAPGQRPVTIEYARQGLVSVKVNPADIPVQFGDVFVVNQGGVDDGKATVLNDGTNAAGAEFIEEVIGNPDRVWIIRLR